MAKLAESVYGDALFELALEENRLEELMEEVRMAETLLQENPELIQLLHHPQIEKSEKTEIIEQIFRGRVSDELTGLFAVVVSKGHTESLEDILQYFLGKGKRYLHIGEAEVASAAALTEAQKAAIENRLLELTQYKKLEMNYKVEPELIGGLVIRMDNRVVDSSIQTKLDNLSKSLKHIQLGEISN